jgi:glutathione S-transferase
MLDMTKTPTYEIYCFGKSDRSCRIRVLLEEFNIPYTDKLLSWEADDHNKPGYLTLNPMGMAPTLLENGVPMIESVACAMYLADRYSNIKPLAPALNSPHRAQYMQWNLFIAATVDPKFNEHMMLVFSEDEARIAKELPALKVELEEMALILENALQGKDFLVGGEFSFADINAGLASHWLLGNAVRDKSKFPGLLKYVEKLKTQPSIIKAEAIKKDA